MNAKSANKSFSSLKTTSFSKSPRLNLENSTERKTLEKECENECEDEDPDFKFMFDYLDTINIPPEETWSHIAELCKALNNELQVLGQEYAEFKPSRARADEYPQDFVEFLSKRDELVNTFKTVTNIESKMKEMEAEILHLQPYVDLMEKFVSEAPDYASTDASLGKYANVNDSIDSYEMSESSKSASTESLRSTHDCRGKDDCRDKYTNINDCIDKYVNMINKAYYVHNQYVLDLSSKQTI